MGWPHKKKPRQKKQSSCADMKNLNIYAYIHLHMVSVYLFAYCVCLCACLCDVHVCVCGLTCFMCRACVSCSHVVYINVYVHMCLFYM
jgi:hypothetical protein